MPEENQKEYKLVSILSPQLEGVDLEKAKKEIEEMVTKFEGLISFKEEKKHNLAYPINKQGQGIYLISQISIVPENIANLSKELKLNKQVLRHLITQLPPIKAGVGKLKPKKVVRRMEKKPVPVIEEKKKEKKVKLEEIDKKLDEIIEEI